MNIVPHNHDFAREQCIAMAFAPLDISTDWDDVIANAGTLDAAALTDELKNGEPYENNEVNKLLVFRLQTKLRIALRHKAGYPQYAEHVCGRCGTHRSDPVMGRSYSVGKCVHCAEHAFLFPGPSSGFSYNTYRVDFDVGTGTWGIAYATKDDREEAAGVIVTGYKTRADAVLARNAPDRFAQLFNRGCPAGLEIDSDDIIPTGELFGLSLPLVPDQWRAFLSKHMRLATPQEAIPYASEVASALKDYFQQSH